MFGNVSLLTPDSLSLSRSIWHLFLPPRGGQSHKVIGWWGDVPKPACIGQCTFIKFGVRGVPKCEEPVWELVGGTWGEGAVVVHITPTPPHSISRWRWEMGFGFGGGSWRRVLGVGDRDWGAWRRGLGSSPHLGRGSRGRGLCCSDSERHSHRSSLHTGGPAGSPGGPWTARIWRRACPTSSPSVRPRRSGQRGHGAFSDHRRLGDHPPSESPRAQQRWRRPAIEEVGRTWAGPQPRGAPD